jgi:hypothetical protein
MDFEWSNANGPTDPSSPFMNIQKQQLAKKREHSGAPKHQSGQSIDASKLTSGPSFGQTGTHSVLDSPSKNGFATPTRLREPDNRPFYFSQESSKPLPLPPHVQNTWEPRTPASTYDFSSGGETPNTPGIDSDAATPDTQLADKMGRLASGDPKKSSRRESWFKRTFGGSPSPLKDRDRDRDDSRKYYSQKADNRIQKRRSERSRSKKRTLHDIDDDDESEQERPHSGMLPPQEQAPVPHTYVTSIAGFMHWLEAHPHLPSVLSYYLQLAVNFVLAGVFVYIIWCAWSAIMADVDIESSKHMSEVMVDIAACAKHYTDNLCVNGAPALAKLCGTWETCMKRDPQKVARASVTAKTFAMIFNSFVEEFSYKSMVCVFPNLGVVEQTASPVVEQALFPHVHLLRSRRNRLQHQNPHLTTVASSPLTTSPRPSPHSSSSAASTSPTGLLASSAPNNKPTQPTKININNPNSFPKPLTASPLTRTWTKITKITTKTGNNNCTHRIKHHTRVKDKWKLRHWCIRRVCRPCRWQGM